MFLPRIAGHVARVARGARLLVSGRRALWARRPGQGGGEDEGAGEDEGDGDGAGVARFEETSNAETSCTLDALSFSPAVVLRRVFRPFLVTADSNAAKHETTAGDTSSTTSWMDSLIRAGAGRGATSSSM